MAKRPKYAVVSGYETEKDAEEMTINASPGDVVWHMGCITRNPEMCVVLEINPDGWIRVRKYLNPSKGRFGLVEEFSDHPRQFYPTKNSAVVSELKRLKENLD